MPDTVEGHFVRSGDYPIIYKSARSKYTAAVDDGDLNILDPAALRHSHWRVPRDDVSELVGAILGTFDYLYGEPPENLTAAYRWANGIASPPDAWVTGGESGGGGAKLGYELVVHVETNFTPRQAPAKRPPSRTWASLTEAYRKRVLGAGRRQGMTAGQVEQYYAAGGSMGDLSGHRNTPRNPSQADPLRNPDYVLARSDFRSHLGIINSIVATIAKAGAAGRIGRDCYLFIIPGNQGNGANPDNLHGV